MDEKKKVKPRQGFLNRAFSPDSTFVRVLNGLSDMVILNLLCIFCSLPVVTAGASITACCQHSNRILNESDSGVLRGFFGSFRDNFKQATPIWLGVLLCGGVLYVDNLILVGMADGMIRSLSRTAVLACWIALLAEVIYVFPLIAVFENTRRACMKNALRIAIRHLPQTVLLFAVTLLPGLIVLLLPGTVGWMVFFMLVIGVEAIIMVNTAVLRKIFPLYMPKP